MSQEAKDTHPEIPWNDMIGMRNRLIHEYFRINLQTVWDTLQNDIPRLVTLVEPLVPPEND
ncbi:MAG: HepT-like ribonuclease domain-containing protein [Candidatus Binatia bacterium]